MDLDDKAIEILDKLQEEIKIAPTLYWRFRKLLDKNEYLSNENRKLSEELARYQRKDKER